MKRQAVQTDRITGKLIFYYVDEGPSYARPKTKSIVDQIVKATSSEAKG